MVEFEPEIVDDPRTTGNGTFLKHSNIDSLVNCFNSQDSRCSGFLIDPPPHNSSYFESQIEAVKNYYLNTSYNNIFSFEYHVIDSVYQLDRKMAEYSELSNYNEPEQSIALLYSDGLELASDEIEDHINSTGKEINDILIVMFHAVLEKTIHLRVILIQLIMILEVDILRKLCLGWFQNLHG